MLAILVIVQMQMIGTFGIEKKRLQNKKIQKI